MSEQASVTDEEWALWRTFSTMRRQLDIALERDMQRTADISAADYEILLALVEAPARQLRVREIADIIGWEKSRISHQVSRMEKRGLVLRRECDSDARGTWVVLTESGRSAVDDAVRDHSANVRRYFFDVLSAEEQAALGRASLRVMETLDPPICSSDATPELPRSA